MSSLHRLVELPPERRRAVLARLSDAERAAVMEWVESQRWARFRDDAVRFVVAGLGETVWSKQVEVLEAVQESKRVAVPASHSVSKTHTAARVAAWWVAVHEPGTAMVITTAPTFRQVRNVLWPHIRRLQVQHGLPGETNLTEWKIGRELVGFGFSAQPNDEAAVQGYHHPHLLIIVDEAGGVGHVLGNAIEGVMTGGDTRLLLIGNPPTDEPNSWFEQACKDPAFRVVRIPADESPNFTGEKVGECRACPSSVPAHSLATHLVGPEWVENAVRRFGADSAFVEARVHARFPRSSKDHLIAWSWIEAAMEPRDAEPGGRVRFGVDVAADGGDEFVIAREQGGIVEVVEVSRGVENASQVQLAGRVLERIRGESEPVRVKIDEIGVGRGLSDLLVEWGREGKHAAKIVPVNVSRAASDPGRWVNQRAELWWLGREVFQSGRVGLVGDGLEDLGAQLVGPRYSTSSSGAIRIEGKAEMKKRGLPSPDRAEAVLLALFEPPGSVVEPVGVVGVSQVNVWALGR